MKKYFVICVSVLLYFAQTSFAQLRINNPLAQKKQELILPVQQMIIPASSKIIPVHIDAVKPIVVSINPAELMNKAKTKCASFKNLKPSLVLKAERINNVTANLQWETKYAFYATGFDIEKSLGDSLHFFTVKFAAASKVSSFKKKYQLPDHNDYSSLSFYRIKQHNGDTGLIYSNVVAVKGYDALPFKIYPVPAKDKVWINIAPRQSGKFAIMVYDLAGKAILEQSASCSENIDVVQSINISQLAAGIYQLKLIMPDKSFLTGKFIKE